MTHTPKLIGYASTSSDQDLSAQVHALLAHGVAAADLYRDTASGRSIARTGRVAALKQLVAGDVLVIGTLDRLARSLADLLKTASAVEQRRAHLRCLTPPLDTSTPGGMLIFQVFGAIGAFERALARERTMAGLAAARAQGRVGGRRSSLTEDMKAKARVWLAQEVLPAEVAKRLGLAKSTIYKHLPDLLAPATLYLETKDDR